MTSSKLVTFRKFNQMEQAIVLANELKEQKIVSEIEDTSTNSLDVYFGKNAFELAILLKIKSVDFEKANKVVETYYASLTNTIDKDYYLFQFTNDELLGILENPYEWGEMDISLAKQILIHRGVEVSEEKIKLAKQSGIDELNKPQTVKKIWIYSAYFWALAGGFLGILIGYSFAYTKKTLPNGELVNIYDKHVQKHGYQILGLGIFC